jgi:pyruvate,water dikinase
VSPLDDPLIAWLGASGPDPLGVASVGGKGASLDRLARFGFRVPPGFAVTTAAFRAEDTSAVEAALLEAVERLVDTLREAGFAPRFAVRSSAVAEDGAAASYAGLHETEPDVPPGDVAASVRRCWASLFSPEAVAYRQRRGVSDADAELAVVVQALVPAAASAVVFTRHPVTGREDQVVLTSSRGLGDAMVAGTITPDTTVVDKASRTLLEFDPGDGSTDAERALDAAALHEIVALALEVEARFGAAVDIEAAYAGGTWYLLQARPITTGAGVGAA